MFQKGLIDELSAEKRVKEINMKKYDLHQLQQSVYDEVNSHHIRDRELNDFRKVAHKVIDVLSKLEFSERYEIVKSRV